MKFSRIIRVAAIAAVGVLGTSGLVECDCQGLQKEHCKRECSLSVLCILFASSFVSA